MKGGLDGAKHGLDVVNFGVTCFHDGRHCGGLVGHLREEISFVEEGHLVGF